LNFLNYKINLLEVDKPHLPSKVQISPYKPYKPVLWGWVRLKVYF